MNTTRPSSFKSTFALVTLVALTSLPAVAATRVEPRFNLYSAQDDAEIGKRSAAEVERELPLVRDRTVQAFVDRVGQRLARHAPGPEFGYRFRVVNAADLNAFALPGGYIYLHRGVLQHARSEGEVAGVLAHEIAHAALRHGTHNLTKATVTQAGIGIVGSLLGDELSDDTARVLETAGGFGLNVLFLKHSRAAETEADLLGAQIMARAGYDPRDMARFFQTIDTQSRRDRGLTIGWLSSHPAPDRRIERIDAEARTLRAGSGSPGGSPSFTTVRSRVAAMPAAPRTGDLVSRAR